MKKTLMLCVVILVMQGSYLIARDRLSNEKALNFPTEKYGISIGNSTEFTGIRINFADKNVKRINGVNVTFWFNRLENREAAVNGVSLGIIPLAGSMQLINLGLFGVGTSPNNLNGVSVGGVAIGSEGDINGLAVSGLLTIADGEKSVIRGVAISGVQLGAHRAINGLGIGGLAVGTDGNINGVASSLAYISAGNIFRGVAVTGGYLNSETFKGVSIAGYHKANKVYGLSIAPYNRSEKLYGVQFGLLNYAGNNPKWLKMLPIINLHL